MARKTRNGVTVVHAPTILIAEVHAQRPARERCRWTISAIARGIVIHVVYAKEKGVEGRPRGVTEGRGAKNRHGRSSLLDKRPTEPRKARPGTSLALGSSRAIRTHGT